MEERKRENSAVIKQTRANVETMLKEIVAENVPSTHFAVSDTGTGKTTGFIAALPKLIEMFPEIRIAIAVPTGEDVENVYNDIIEGGFLREDELGLWSTWHCPNNKDARYPQRMTLQEAGERIVFLGTHVKIRGEKEDPKTHIGKRDLVIIDEVPSDFKIVSLSPTDFAAARKLSQSKGLKTQGTYAKASTKVGTRQTSASRSENTKLSKLTFPSSKGLREDLERYNSVELRETLEPIIDFLEASEQGRSFERIQRRKDGSDVYHTYFSEPAKHFDLKVIFSATAHLEGYQINPEARKNLIRFKGTKVNFSNLTVRTAPWPHGVNKYMDRMLTSYEQTETALDHIMWLIGLTTSNEVLVVVPLKIRDRLEKRLAGDFMAGDKNIRVTNWGRDVGSNQYWMCKDVILWSNYFKPLDVTAAEYHVFADKLVSNTTLKNFRGGTVSGDAKILKDGQLYSNFKQMANRGHAREIQGDGSCGEMNLWISWIDFDPLFLDVILPGCQFSPVEVVDKRFLGKSSRVIDKVVDVLKGIDADTQELNSSEYARLVGKSDIVARNQLNKLFSKDTEHHALATLKLYGWSYVKGKRGKNPTLGKFIRVEAHEDEYDANNLWNPNASKEWNKFNSQKHHSLYGEPIERKAS